MLNGHCTQYQYSKRHDLICQKNHSYTKLSEMLNNWIMLHVLNTKWNFQMIFHSKATSHISLLLKYLMLSFDIKKTGHNCLPEELLYWNSKICDSWEGLQYNSKHVNCGSGEQPQCNVYCHKLRVASDHQLLGSTRKSIHIKRMEQLALEHS